MSDVIRELTLTPEPVSLVNHTNKSNLVCGCIVLDASEDCWPIDVCLMAVTGRVFFSEKGPRSAALSFATCSLGDCDF